MKQMKVYELIRQLQNQRPNADVYVYDERRDTNRVILHVGTANYLMPPGTVISIGAAFDRIEEE